MPTLTRTAPAFLLFVAVAGCADSPSIDRPAEAGQVSQATAIGVPASPTAMGPSMLERCGASGASAFKGAGPVIPIVPAAADRGTVITVTSASDDPGATTSLRSALETANRSSGPVTIRFAPVLSGKTIHVGAEDLPPIDASDLTIDGDIDGDGRPDITIRASRQHSSSGFVNGLTLRSGGNRLHALALEGFSIAVHFMTIRTGQHYAGNTVSALVIRDAGHAAIQFTGQLGGAPPNTVVRTDNRWTDITVIGNTITTNSDGISFAGHWAQRNKIERLVVARNTVEVRNGGRGSGLGISINAGFWAGSEQNQASDVVIADNVISGNPQVGIRIAAGDVGASDNVIERVQVVGNRIDIAPLVPTGNLSQGIALQVGDSSTAYQLRDHRPVGYPSRNRLDSVTVAANHVRGFGEMGISVDAGYNGALDNRVTRLRIEGNTLSGELLNTERWQSAAISLFAGSTSLRLLEFAHSRGNSISEATISANTIVLRDSRTAPQFATVGAIHLQGGRNADLGSIRGVRISANDISSTVPGVLILGGYGEGAITSGNEIDAAVECNVLRQHPRTSFSRFVGTAAGITVVGGHLTTTRDGVDARENNVRVVARDNEVAGRTEDPLILANTGRATTNHASVVPGQRP